MSDAGNVTNQIGKKIRVARINRKLKQYELAERINVSANYISLIESGKKKPSLRTLHNIANTLEVSISSLLEDNDCVLSDLREIAKKYGLDSLVKGLQQIQDQADSPLDI